MSGVGDEVYLGSLVANLHFWGVVGDGETPPMVNGSFELSGTDGTVTLDALVGPQGVPGAPSPIVRMQYQDNFDEPSELPTNLTNTEADIGKAWWVGNTVYMWTGTTYYEKQMGVPGPPGPVPNITFSTQIVPSGTVDSLAVPVDIVQSGTDLNPGVLIRFDADSIRGPQGTASPLRGAPDYDNSVQPADGQAIVWNSQKQKFVPGSFDMLSVRMYSIPEANFNSYIGFGTRQLVGSFAVPPQPFDWKPMVWGHIRAQGVDSNLLDGIFTIGAEVTLGDALSGQRIGRGFGNISNWTTIVPHFSTPSAQATAVTPENGVAFVPAYHSGSQGTLYVSLFNDGAVGQYSFDKNNAQLIVMVVPVSVYQTASGS
jgi:hypothetical protein